MPRKTKKKVMPQSVKFKKYIKNKVRSHITALPNVVNMIGTEPGVHIKVPISKLSKLKVIGRLICHHTLNHFLKVIIMNI